MIKQILNLFRGSKLPLFIVSALSFTTSAQYCETVLDDFESNRQISSYTVLTLGTLVQNQANPSVTGVNTSSTCAKYTSNPNVYGQGTVALKLNKIKNANLFKNGLLRFKLDIYTPNTGTVSMHLQKNGVLQSSQTAELKVANTWTTLYFSTYENSLATNTVFADSITEINISLPMGNITAYIDNIAIYGAYSSIDNFDSERNVAVSSVQGTLNPAFANGASNPMNSSSKCATFRKATGNANSQIKYALPSTTSASRLKAGIDRFGISLYPLTSAIPVKISLLDTNVVPHAVHSVYQGTTISGVTGTWNFVRLALLSQSNVADGDVDVLALEIDPSVVSTTLYRFDDLLVYNTLPAIPTIVGTSSPCTGTNLYDYSVTNLAGLSYEWVIRPQGTIVSGANTNKIQAQFTSVPTSIECRAIIPGGCASPWAVMSFANVNKPATVTAARYNTSTQPVCQNKGVELQGSFQGANSAVWSSNGSGTFSPNNTSERATYLPSKDDADLGTVDLTYTSQGGNCGAKSSNLSINIIPAVEIIDISPNVEICTSQKTIKLSASTNVGGLVHWYGYPGTFDKPQVTSGGEVVFTFASYNQVLGNSIELKAETDYNYACGYTAKYVLIKFIGSDATPSVRNTICYADTAVTLGGTISGNATGGIWSTTGTGTFSPSATTLNATYTVTEQDRLNASVDFTLTTTGDAKCTVSKSVKLGIRAPFTQPDPAPIAPSCGAMVINISLDTAKGFLKPDYEWQYSYDSKYWHMATKGLNLQNYQVPANTNIYLRRQAYALGYDCKIATKPIFIKAGAPVENNSLTGSNTVCYGDQPGVFTGSTPTGGIAITPYYQWQVSTTGDSLDFVNIPGKVFKDLRADVVPYNEYFRRVVLSKDSTICPHSISNVVTTTVEKCTGINAFVPKIEFCEGEEFVVDFATTNLAFPVGNIFTVQVSTSSTFNNNPYPISIGSLVSSETSGKINCKFVVPSSGGNFFLRVVASDPTLKSYIVRNLTFRTVRTGFTLNATRVTTTTQVVLSNNVVDFQSGTWDFGTGAVYQTPVSVLNPILTYPTTGTRTITLMATTKYGCSKTFSNQITVLDYKCDVKPSSKTTIFATTDSIVGTLPNNASAWIKPGANYTHKAGNNDTIYVSAGGRLSVFGNVTGLVVYLEPNARYSGSSSVGINHLLYSPTSIVSPAPSSLGNAVLCNQVSINGGVVTDIQDGNHGEFATTATVYPNPSTEGKFTVMAPDEVIEVSLVNSLGMKETHHGTQIETQMRGLLLVTIKTANRVYMQKVTVIE